MAYSFRFKVLDGVTAPVNRIASTFRAAQLPVTTWRRSLASLSPVMGKVRSDTVGFTRTIDQVPKQVKRSSTALAGIKRTLAGVFAVREVFRFGGAVTSTLAEFEKYEAVLSNTFGDASAAKRVMEDIKETAASTPFQVNELTGAFVKLANRGFVPTQQEMINLSDLASSTGKGFDQLAEAALDAQTGEFERLKEFGIIARKEGDRVRLSFKGIEKDVRLDKINEALLELSRMDGVAGSSQAIMNTTGGMISNLSDMWTQLKESLGSIGEPFLKLALPKLIKGVGFISDWIKANLVPIQNAFKSLYHDILKPIIGGMISQFISVKKAILSAFPSLGEGQTWMKVFEAVKLVAQGIGAALALVGKAVEVILPKLVEYASYVVNFFLSLPATIAKVGQWLWDHSPFAFIVDLVDRVFPSFREHLSGLWTWVKSLFTRVKNWIYEKFISPIGEWFSGILNFINDPFSKADIKLPGIKKEESETQQDDTTFYQSLNSIAGGNSKSKSSFGSGGSKPVSSALAGSVSGGGNIKNININIQEFGKFTFTNIKNMEMGMEELKRKMKMILLDLMNDANLASG